MAALEPVLNELSVCETGHVEPRLVILANTLNALSRLGLPTILRHHSGALDRHVSGQVSFKAALFAMNRGRAREEAQVILRRISKVPYVEELLTFAEGSAALEVTHDGALAFGLGHAALAETVAVSLSGIPTFDRVNVPVTVMTVSEGGVECFQDRAVQNVSRPEHVAACQEWYTQRRWGDVRSGSDLWERRADLLPRTLFGARAETQLRGFSGRERYFSHVCRHLHLLDLGVEEWGDSSYAPSGALNWSQDSAQTLKHRDYGPKRDFPVPVGVAPERFSFHSKIFEGNQRIYFLPVSTGARRQVVIGYIGDHLPTVEYPT